MAGHRLNRAHRPLVRHVAEGELDGGGLGLVVVRRAGAVGIDPRHFVRRDAGGLERADHCQRLAFRVGGGVVGGIERPTLAEVLGKDGGAA